jgi:hypothetical protein
MVCTLHTHGLFDHYTSLLMDIFAQVFSEIPTNLPCLQSSEIAFEIYAINISGRLFCNLIDQCRANAHPVPLRVLLLDMPSQNSPPTPECLAIPVTTQDTLLASRASRAMHFFHVVMASFRSMGSSTRLACAKSPTIFTYDLHGRCVGVVSLLV